MPFAQEGVRPLLSGVVLICLGLLFFPPLALVGLFLLGVVAWFYRDPVRQCPADPGVLVSPADGKVVEVGPVEHPFTGPCTRVGIFMSPLDVHVNRAPCDGEVVFLEYVPGKKMMAFEPKASELNERFYMGLHTVHGPVLTVQIAGFLARRISTDVRRGAFLSRGVRFGMIKLGSRVDVYFPEGFCPAVTPGQRVRAGETVIGVIRS